MKDSDSGYKTDPDMDCPSLPGEEQTRIRVLMEKMMAMGLFAVYGEEDDQPENVVLDCASNLLTCKAACCRLHFALTKEEVKRGRIRHDLSKPFFIARDEDGYCPHLDRTSLKCTVWEDRPVRCRNYDCMKDTGKPSVL